MILMFLFSILMFLFHFFDSLLFIFVIGCSICGVKVIVLTYCGNLGVCCVFMLLMLVIFIYGGCVIWRLRLRMLVLIIVLRWFICVVIISLIFIISIYFPFKTQPDSSHSNSPQTSPYIYPTPAYNTTPSYL